ncbi:MAG: hypothetical protein IPJ14_12830 [Kineosporiaceae bacterium]|nr:hypothetical protein [Kineosporiaceae bacterium]
MSVMQACFAESGDPDEVAALRAECAQLRARDGELRTACGRLERRVNRLSEEQDWATRRIARLTERCTHLAELVPVAALTTLPTRNAPEDQTASDEDRSPAIVGTADSGRRPDGVNAPGGPSPADALRGPDGVSTVGEPGPEGLVAALAGEAGARLAAAVQTAVGDLAALSIPDPDAGVELGCLADLPDRAVADLAAAGCRLATWAKLAATIAAEELVTRWENGAADDADNPVNAQPVFADHDLGYRAAIAETATTCVLAETTLAARVDTLRELPARLPGLWHLLATGEVDIDTARLVHAKTRHLPGETLTRLEPQLLVKVTALTYGQLAAWLDRIVAKADPRDLAEQIADNIERRRVAFRTAGPGTGRMTLTTSVEAIEAIRMALLAHASAGDDPDQPRPTAAIRADIITDLITGTGTPTGAGTTEAATQPEPQTESPSNAAADDDAQAEAKAQAEAEAEDQPDANADTQAASPSDAESESDAEPEAEFEPEAEAEFEPEAEREPDARCETEAEANDVAPDTPTGTGTGACTPTAATGPPGCRPPQPFTPDSLASLPGPRVHITVPLSAVLGGDGIGEANDYGPLTADAIRDLLAGLHRMGVTATWRCLITDDTPGSPTHGTVLGIGKAPHALVRTATGLLRELVQAREQCCTFPGCRRRAITCEVDHRIPHSQDGPTCECNLHPLCKHHHRLRERGFTPTLIDPGTGLPITQWVTPTGRIITTESEHPPF